MAEHTRKRRAGRPNQEESEQKQKGLIIAALAEFARAGFHGASLRNIAAQAEISSRTLYNYYPDKLSLFEACLEHSASHLRPVLPELKGNLYERLVDYTIAMQRQLFIPQALQIAKLIYREATGFEELRRIARNQFERHQVAPVVAILKGYGVAEERCVPLAAQFIAMALGEWQRRLLFGAEPMTEREMAAQAELVAEIFVYGIGREYPDTNAAPE